MKKLSFARFLCVSMMFGLFVACDKSSDSEVKTNAEDPVLLVACNEDWDGGYDYSTIAYNDNNQVVKIVNTYTEDGEEECVTSEYYYNDNGDLAEEIFQFKGENEKYKTVFTKEGSILTYKDYVLSDDSTWKNLFSGASVSYDEQQKIALFQNYVGWSAEEITFVDSSVYVWNNDNVVEKAMYEMDGMYKKSAKVQYLYSSNSVKKEGILKSGNFDTKKSYKYVYDDKHNPFATVSFDYQYVFQNKNNVIQEVLTPEDGTDGYDHNISYEYNDEDYPIRGIVKEGGVEIRTITYTYGE